MTVHDPLGPQPDPGEPAPMPGGPSEPVTPLVPDPNPMPDPTPVDQVDTEPDTPNEAEAPTG